MMKIICKCSNYWNYRNNKQKNIFFSKILETCKCTEIEPKEINDNISILLDKIGILIFLSVVIPKVKSKSPFVIILENVFIGI